MYTRQGEKTGATAERRTAVAAMTAVAAGGRLPEHRGAERPGGVVRGLFRTPWGDGLVSVWAGRLVGVELPPLAREMVPKTEDCGGLQEDHALLQRWVGQLEAYFRGERLSWTIGEVDLDSAATSPFTRSVYETLLSVPAGVTVSYGVLAEMAGFPRAARAVGTAMASNCIPIVVPCHRVIRSDGSLGRYGEDPTWKERLLAHERSHAGGVGGDR